MARVRADPERGHASNANRDAKARAILKTVRHYRGFAIERSNWLDVGCGSGSIAAQIAPSVGSILGIDPHPWREWSDHLRQHANLSFRAEPISAIEALQNSFDVIICNQVYEHVDDPEQLIASLFLLLKPGGVCYFAGPNLLFPIEPHVFWPFVHWLPRKPAQALMRVLGSKGVLDANSTHYWRLLRWLRDFDVENAIPYILKSNDQYEKSSWFGIGGVWRILKHTPDRLIRLLTPLSPGFVFILRKPAAQDPGGHP